jgi:hypothetical protein
MKGFSCFRGQSLTLRRRSQFAITDTELKLMARQQRSDSAWHGSSGYRAPAANGIPGGVIDKSKEQILADAAP